MKKFFKCLFIVVFFLSFVLFLYSKQERVEAATSYPFQGIIHADSLVVYSDTQGTKVTELAYGTKVVVTASGGSLKNGSSTICSSSYKFTYDTDKTGYACASLITNVDTSIKKDNISSGDTYDLYCTSLKSQGFDESYCPYLYYLHSKHPNWTFKADVLAHPLTYYSSLETGKVVLQTNNSNYWYSSKPIESDYYYIKQSTIEPFMDPRNSLFENRIFMFLDLEASKNIVNDTALKKIAGTGNLSNYYTEFKNASSTYGINSVHLMTRSQQEGANSSSYSAITGLYTTTNNRFSSQGWSLDGYYNFFNIGSYADSTYSYTVQRGLAHGAGFIGNNESCFTTSEVYNEKLKKNVTVATYKVSDQCKALSFARPWNTPEAAINGGASFLVDKYVGAGQDTLYYQKFNISSYTNTSIVTNQYMTNIYAPASESNTMYSAYNAGGLLDSKFTFIIPVYQDMTSEGYQPIDKDSNSKLSSISVNDQVITGFDSDVTEYNYNLTTDSSSFKVGAKTASSTSSVNGTGNYSFVNGSYQVSLVVKAEDGTTTTYHITVKQVLPVNNVTVDEIVSKMAVKVNGSIMYGISPETVVGTLISTVTNNKGTAKVVDANGKAKTTGNLATGDKITIMGTTETKIYTIAVRGDINGDGSISVLDLLRCQKHILKSVVLTGEQYYAADTNYDNSITVLDLLKIQKHILGSAHL